MNNSEKIELCKKYSILLGRDYSSYSLDPEVIAMLISADLNGDFVLVNTDQNFKWEGSFKEFLHNWDIISP